MPPTGLHVSIHFLSLPHSVPFVVRFLLVPFTHKNIYLWPSVNFYNQWKMISSVNNEVILSVE